MNFRTLILLAGASGLFWSCSNEPEFDQVKQFEKEQAAILDYLESNNIDYEQESSNELYYTINEEGTGSNPEALSWINVNYETTILGDDEIILEEDSVIYNLSSVFSGWRVLMPLVKEGGNITMYVPSYYAFGRDLALDGAVPGNSTVVFDVKLIQSFTQNEFETLAIENYIKQEELVAEQDSVSGLYYVILEEGDGNFPNSNSTVNVDYIGNLFPEGDVFDTGNGLDFRLNTVIDGWQILMPYIQEGGTIMMFITSQYGYGGNAVGDIPPYSPLVFEVTLNEITSE